MQLITLTIIFLCYMMYREWMYGVHIKDLETKLMAKDANEYIQLKAIETPKKSIAEKTDSDLIDPFDANPNDYLKGLDGQ